MTILSEVQSLNYITIYLDSLLGFLFDIQILSIILKIDEQQSFHTIRPRVCHLIIETGMVIIT